MKIILFFFLITVNIYAQFEKKLDTTSNNCIEQFEKAKKDFEINKYKLIIQKPAPFNETLKNLIEEEGITVEFPRIFFETCYNSKIKDLLNKKYSTNFIKYLKQKADSLNKLGKGNRSAKLNTKEKTLQEFIEKNITKEELRILKEKYKNQNIWLNMTISKKGKCVLKSMGTLDKIIVESFQETSKNIKEIKEPIIYKIINKRKLYLPKTINGKAVESEFLTRLCFEN